MNVIKALLFNLFFGMVVCSSALGDKTQTERPNIIWLMAEDISNDLECYGTPGVQTPNLNALADQGVRYTNCFATAPSCAPARSAMLTGVHQNIIEAQHQRCNRNTPLKDPYKPFTHWLRKAGYTCILGHHGKGHKIDANYKISDLGPYDGADQFGVFDKLDTFKVSDQPFFAQITLYSTHRGDWWKRIRRESDDPVDTSEIQLPPFMADHPAIRIDWARYLDQIEFMDARMGEIMEELKDKGMDQNTIVIFIGDNGRCVAPRGKGFLYDSGLRVPLIVRWPGRLKEGQVSDQLVSLTDVTASILNIAGAKVPDYLTGQPFITEESDREAVFSVRGMLDEVLDKIWSITTRRYRYIRNYMPWKPYDAHLGYYEFYRPALHIMRQMHMDNKLTPVQAHFFKNRKPEEELYDLRKDPHETENLVNDPRYRDVLLQMRSRMEEWKRKVPETTTEDFHIRAAGAPRLLDWVRYNRPQKYQQMLEGELIGYGRMQQAYRAYRDSLKNE